ncbi:hypothetical protein HYALB_00004699 [Hymenoscyphus albidus]|uniref:Uncharacterized protein n=1 Tax=Hymenoscyphus albidus TaxID=595503 RepID=A0A9N9LU85_9HELO|nr:hypothetical protein HYALB_00004699 [Hymenoscyphus albidus]
MNDPGLDEPIAGNAEDVENIERDEEEAEEDEESDYLQPAIWWFTSTAFPLMAGTFGPMASAFSICSLAVHWRVEIPPGKTEADGLEVPDPSWQVPSCIHNFQTYD